ncbi:hypothetical protein B0H10DRAFT_542858 [Mycena sp. CBHHK59/15]|nr:hypothetical protein B0H10DRAFT_542858 [Mycena sp. CBHHK59/15]
MVAPGGPALDDDVDEHVERPTTGKQKKGKPAARSIAIKNVAPKELTGKAIRGGSAKWTLRHLPAGTGEEFTNEVVPLACEQAGLLGPWMGLTVKQIQVIVDKVYGAGVHKVAPKDVWVGLIGYRLHNWRNGFATQGEKALQMLIDNDEAQGEGEEGEHENEEQMAPPRPFASSLSKPPRESRNLSRGHSSRTTTACWPSTGSSGVMV